MLHDETGEILPIEHGGREMTAPEHIEQALRIAIAGLELIQRQLRAGPGRELSRAAEMAELELIQGQLVRQYEALTADREADRVLRTTEQASLAHERAARAEAERAVRLRNDALSVVIHDLKNPLMTIKVAAEVLRRELEAMAPRRSPRSARGWRA